MIVGGDYALTDGQKRKCRELIEDACSGGSEGGEGGEGGEGEGTG